MLKMRQRVIMFCAVFAMLAMVLFSMPGQVLAAQTQNSLADGTYMVSVLLEGGSGRASITSPAKLIVEDNKAMLSLEWSSSNYDYMIVEGVTYYPQNAEGNSVFLIPVTVFDEPIEVIADTTAMSVPHEITYQITVDSSALKKEGSIADVPIVVGCLAVLLVVAIGFFAYKRKRK